MRCISTVIVIVLSLSMAGFAAPDKPTGFASVSGNGLTTTTGGEGGTTVTVSTWGDLKKYAEATDPHIILVNGTLTAPSFGAMIGVTSNKTIVGLGDNATISKGELQIMYQKNIIIRNLIIRDSNDGTANDFDAIQADGTHHLWIDHCHFTNCGDGLIDLRKVCDYVTISWTILSNHNKAFGIGWTEETDFRKTINHCWFNKTHQRNPSFDMGMGHLYNNYQSDVTSYGNYARGKARLVIENSVFERVSRPIHVDATAKCYISGLQFISCTGSNTGNVSSMPFDPKSSYNYTLTPTSEVKKVVMEGAGPKAHIGAQYTGTTASQPLIKSTHAPTTEAFRLEGHKIIAADFMGDATTVSIFNLRGELVHRTVLLQRENLDLSKVLVKGSYIVKISSNGRNLLDEAINVY